MKNQMKNSERVEEVQHIIDRMPSRLGIKITTFVLLIVIVFFSLGWIIKYPDVVSGAIVVNASSSPIRLVSNTSGKLQLNGLKNHISVEEGQYIATLQSGTNLKDLKKIATLCASLQIKDGKNLDKLHLFPKVVSLGETNILYFKFLNSFTKLTNYYHANLYDQQIEALNKEIIEFKERLRIVALQLKMSIESLKFMRKSHSRDSILYAKKVLAESENDKSEIALISARDLQQNLLREISNTRSQLHHAEDQIQQIALQKLENEKQLQLDLISSFTELEDGIKTWEQKYVFKAPIKGKVQFLKFWSDNQFVEAGAPIFSIVPHESNIIGQMTLPATGAGKVIKGQEVIIKLDDYPYVEYGSIKGTVSSIGLIPNAFITKDGSIETYLVNVDLPNGLRTNYNKELPFRFEIKGGGDIITTERRLIQRLFDNLNYKLNE